MFVDTTLLRMGLFEGSNISFIDAEYVICIRYPDCWWLLVESDVGIFIESFKNALLEVKLPYEPSCPFRLLIRSVCHYFLERHSCAYRNNCLSLYEPLALSQDKNTKSFMQCFSSSDLHRPIRIRILLFKDPFRLFLFPCVVPSLIYRVSHKIRPIV